MATDDYKKLEERIKKIESRNLRVEKDKAWETSAMRRLLLVVFTYLMIALYMKFVLDIDPWLNAIIPTLGFYLSTLTLPFFRKIWEKLFYKS
ncbi:hypothetical protein M1328_04120 [Patescibacteria group bacterium]|nr:hypothetical protein [Patescibacteria group bacterium]